MLTFNEDMTMTPIDKPHNLKEAKEIAEKLGVSLKDVDGGRYEKFCEDNFSYSREEDPEFQNNLYCSADFFEAGD